MKKAPTIRDVAKAAKVSVSVVSRVLNKGTGPVAPATREKVVATIEKLSYRPRSAARELNRGKAETLGLLLPDLANPFFALMADRIIWESRARGVQVVLMTTHEDPNLERQILEMLLGRSVGGVIATPTDGNIKGWKRLRDVGIEIVFVDRTIPGLDGVDLVSIRNDESARLATSYLLGLGHRRIGFISGPLSASTGKARVKGYRSALEEHGIEFDPALVQHVAFRGEVGSEAAQTLWSLDPRPSAVIMANTAQVPNALRWIMQTKIAIPEKLSVIVFDDNPWTQLVTPPLTAVRQPVAMLATHSVELLLGRMQGKLPAGSRQIEVESEFVVRTSCAQFQQR